MNDPMDVVYAVCGGLLAASLVLAGVFVVRARGIVDRAVGLDLSVSVLLNALAIVVVATLREAIDLVLLIGMLAFVGTVTIARFIERRGVTPAAPDDGEPSP